MTPSTTRPEPSSRLRLRVYAGIPARYHSTRFPGKPLSRIGGKPMIEHVYQRTAAVSAIEKVIVATDDSRIVAAVEAFGGVARLTRAEHGSGTERLAEVFAEVDCDLVVNVQGDEPLIDPRSIALAIEPFESEPGLQVSTLKTRLRERDALLSPHVVKVADNRTGFAVAFSRQPIPPLEREEDWLERADFKHLGVYVYTRLFLLHFPQLRPTPGEQAERLEQLRILEHGIPIKVVETPYDSIGVDTPDDLARVEALLTPTRG